MSTQNLTQRVNFSAEKFSVDAAQADKALFLELHKIAQGHRARWHGNDTLSATALVNEAFIRLHPMRGKFANRKHYFATAAKTMRQVLINYAEKSVASKRQAPAREEIDSPQDEQTLETLIWIDRILESLGPHQSRLVSIVECRIFAGMSIAETAEHLGVSVATVKRDWRSISNTMFKQMREQPVASSAENYLNEPPRD